MRIQALQAPRSCAARAALLASLLVAAQADAAGFEVYEQAPAGTAMAGALTAVPGDASAIFYNPAGLAFQRGGSFIAGSSVAVTDARMITADGTRTDAPTQLQPLPTGFLSVPVLGRFVVGLGAFSQFSSAVTWNQRGATTAGQPTPFAGRFLGQSAVLQTLTINPTVAMRVTDRVSVALGFDVLVGSLDLRRALSLGDGEGAAHLGGAGNALGFNVGVMAIVIPGRLSVGLAYRSGLALDFDLAAHFDVPVELSSSVKDQPASVSLPLPHNFSLGLALLPLPRLSITADVHASLWSDLQSLSVTFRDPAAPAVSSARSWRDALSVRVGLELMATRGLALRFGWGYEQTPVPASTLDPLMPSSDRWLVAGGLGYTHPTGAARGLSVSLGYLAGISAARTSQSRDLPGASYAQTSQMLSLALGYRWDLDRAASEGGEPGGDSRAEARWVGSVAR